MCEVFYSPYTTAIRHRYIMLRKERHHIEFYIRLYSHLVYLFIHFKAATKDYFHNLLGGRLFYLFIFL